MNEVSASNQRSVRKAGRKTSSRGQRNTVRMPRITLMGKLAKVTKGPAKKIGKE